MNTRSLLRTLAFTGLLLCSAAASATAIFLQPSAANVGVGSNFSVNIFADIDAAHEIIGFGFDLSGSNLGLVNYGGFSAGPGFADDPIFLAPISDADGIRGASAGDLLLGPPVSGTGILLGTLTFQALSLGLVDLSLDADDLSFFFSEGLIPLDIALTNFLPVINGAQINIVASQQVDEPSSALLCGWLVLGLATFGARRPRKTLSA